MATSAVDVVVTGRVQGVFFRAAAREQAARLGVTGWVRNEPDGTVSGHFEGSPEAVDELVAWCARGSDEARVDDVRRLDAEVTGASSFEAG